MESTVETTQELLSTLLDVSRLDSGEFTPEVQVFNAGTLLNKINIADYTLPKGETGIDVIERIRIEVGLDIPAIIVTGDTSHPVQGNLKGNAYKFLNKPVI